MIQVKLIPAGDDLWLKPNQYINLFKIARIDSTSVSCRLEPAGSAGISAFNPGDLSADLNKSKNCGFLFRLPA